MPLKTTDKILHAIELAILLLSLAGWAALGFPAWKPVVALGLTSLAGICVFQWFLSQQS